MHQYLSRCFGHTICCLSHIPVYVSYSNVFIHACRCHSHGRPHIPMYGLNLDLVIQTTSTNSKSCVLLVRSVTLHANVSIHEGEFIFSRSVANSNSLQDVLASYRLRWLHTQLSHYDITLLYVCTPCILN